MADINKARRALVARLLEGDGTTSHAQRRAAFDDGAVGEPLGTLVQKVARAPSTVTDADIAAARASGLSEDQVFEIVVCSAVGQATRQYDSAFAALDAATSAPAAKE